MSRHFSKNSLAYSGIFHFTVKASTVHTMMRSCILLSTCILISLYLPSKASWNKHIYVSPSGNDTQSCGKANQPCKSLDEAFAIALNGSGGANSTLISAAKGNYTLTKTFNFTNVNTFALVGEALKSDEVRIRCEPNVSLSFIYSVPKYCSQRFHVIWMRRMAREHCRS